MRNVEDIYPLSPTQQGLLFHSLYAPEAGVYVQQLSCVFNGKLNVEVFIQCWERAVERHPLLRTSFAWERLEEPLQVVLREVALPSVRQDWRGLSEAQQRERLRDFLREDREQGFDVSGAPLMRVAFIRTGEDACRFVWTSHHLLLDGWSLFLLLEEVFVLYEARCRGEELRLLPVRAYRDYIAWLQQQDLAAAEAFWRRTLKGFDAPTQLRVGKPHGASAGGGDD